MVHTFTTLRYIHTPLQSLQSLLLDLLNSEINEEIAQQFNITPPFRLEDFTYRNRRVRDLVFEHLANTSFDGVTVRPRGHNLTQVVSSFVSL